MIYIYIILNECVFIRLKNMKDINDSYQTNYSLKEFESFWILLIFFESIDK